MHIKFKEVSLYNVKFTCNNYSNITQLVVARNRLCFCLSAVKQWHINHTKTHVCSQFWFVTLLIPWKNQFQIFTGNPCLSCLKESVPYFAYIIFCARTINVSRTLIPSRCQCWFYLNFMFFFHSKKLKSIIDDPHNSSSFMPNFISFAQLQCT